MVNGVMLQAFEWYTEKDGGHWRRLKKQARRLRRLGFTAIWLPPAYKGMYGANETGYAVYDLYDLGEFRQKNTVRTAYGTRKEYLSLLRKLRRLKLDALPDVVLNHRFGGDAKE